MDLDPRTEEDQRVKPNEETKPYQLGAKEGQVTFTGTQLEEAKQLLIVWALDANADLSAWSTIDMPSIDPNYHCCSLSMCWDVRTISQKKRKVGKERRRAIQEEVRKFLTTQFIRETWYTTWLLNVFMVNKSNGKWRMCTGYTDHNKACPKDAYPLPTIDKLVDGAIGHHLFSFLDAYSGYNQIQMHPRDEEKMNFIIESTN